ncbi:phage tail assembly chaperone [Burkholderia metallica]|uniref:Phage tail assembly chaperone n=1 Tax=Burkholderia metallica TaxID=488729 RepID=A0ABT8PMZ4_9BURK|nr:phage tail assembly chaperone [Burkholderia metallica]MDN7936443.1 phage tail assembly chaperone [Burkholderia metallica]
MAVTYVHNHMIAAIKKLYPGALHGVDFLVGHSLDPETGGLMGLPWIAAWRRPELQPADEVIHKEFADNEREYRAVVIREQRDACLRDSDSRTAIPPDAPASVQETAALWVEYRQRLRDITIQPGFPFDVEWPEAPAA